MVNKIIDVHVHCGKDIDGREACKEDLIKQKEKNNITKLVVFSFNTPNLLQKSREILEESKTADFIIPFLRFNPNTITEQDLTEHLSKKFKGIKLHPRSQNFNPADKKFSWIFEEIKKYNIPVLIHSRMNQDVEPQSHPKNIIALAKDFPEINFIIGHNCGGNKYIYKELLDLNNVYVETSICSCHYDFEYAYKKGFTRFVFGSDYPYSLPEIELLKIRRAEISEELKEKILWKNAAKLLKINF